MGLLRRHQKQETLEAMYGDEAASEIPVLDQLKLWENHGQSKLPHLDDDEKWGCQWHNSTQGVGWRKEHSPSCQNHVRDFWCPPTRHHVHLLVD